MSVRFDDLYQRVRDEDIKLVAGGNGRHRPVSWIHMVESPEIASFLEGGEVAIVTGVGLDRGHGLLELVKLIDSYHASGIVINVGPYITAIPQEVILYCDEHELPLLEAPWSTHMARIMRIFEIEISRADRVNMELAAALENAIRAPEQPELYLTYLERNGFDRSWNYCVAVMETSSNADVTMETLRHRARGVITLRGWRCAVLVLDERLVVVMANVDENTAGDWAAELAGRLRAGLQDGVALYAGVGGVTKSARCIGKSYSQAVRLEQLERKAGKAGTVPIYAGLGVYKLLLAIDDRQLLREFCEQTIGPLATYDEANGTDILGVLRLYLESCGRVRDVADALFVHRNTVNYKIRHAGEILGVDLSDGRVREELLLGIQIYDLL